MTFRRSIAMTPLKLETLRELRGRIDHCCTLGRIEIGTPDFEGLVHANNDRVICYTGIVPQRLRNEHATLRVDLNAEGGRKSVAVQPPGVTVVPRESSQFRRMLLPGIGRIGIDAAVESAGQHENRAQIFPKSGWDGNPALLVYTMLELAEKH